MQKGGRFGLVTAVSAAKSMYHRTLLKMTDMEQTYDVSKYSPIDKANLYYAIALDNDDEAEQVNYLIAALHQAQKGGLKPIDFLIERMSNIPQKQFHNATHKTRSRLAGNTQKCTGGCDACSAEKCQPKISVSVGEVLDEWRNAYPPCCEADE